MSFVFAYMNLVAFFTDVYISCRQVTALHTSLGGLLC